MTEESSLTRETSQDPASSMLRGTPVAPGLSLGFVHRKDYDLLKVQPQRVPLDQIERELNRFHRALKDSRAQLEDLKQRLQGKVPPDHARILDTHVAYLRDTVFLSDVENLILNEQMGLEAAIVKVIADFDRIFRLVENETLRERAVDLRDVGIRVLRNIELQEEGPTSPTGPEPEVPDTDVPRDYILVARELSIVDMFNLQNEHVAGIITEEGGLTGHAAILARSMRIPTVTGVDKLLDEINERDYVILDATEGVVQINPDELVRSQYREASEQREQASGEATIPDWAVPPFETDDGIAIEVSASAGSLPDVEQAMGLGLESLGLYRTELLYMVEKRRPSLDPLIAHYSAVIAEADGKAVTFRLLTIDSGLGVDYLHDQREANPKLGRSGIRALLANEQVLRTQLQAILRAATGDAKVRIALPFVVDCGELRRVKEILFEERFELRRLRVPFGERVELGTIIETPAAALGVQGLVQESDFLLLSLDSLLQYSLAADRENLDLGSYFEVIHPVVLRLVQDISTRCLEEGKKVTAFGVSAVRSPNLSLLIGCGMRSFSVAPVNMKAFLTDLRSVNAEQASRAASRAAAATCQADALPFVEGLSIPR